MPRLSSVQFAASIPYVEAFLEMLSVERGASSNTLEAYSRDLIHTFVSLKNKPLHTSTSEELRTYFHFLFQEGYSAGTRARRLSTLRQFYRFLLDEEVLTHDPCSVLDAPKQGKALPKILSEEEVQTLLLTASHLQGEEGIRAFCLLEMLYATGMRVSELVSLPLGALSSLDQEDLPALIITGKGGKERWVPLSEPALQTLQAYLKIRSRFLTGGRPCRWLFPSQSRQGHLTRQRFGQILKEIALKAGIAPRKVSPHVIRHAFASHLLHHGMDLMSLQKLLGHSDISTTEIYTHVLTERLKSLVLDLHPLSKPEKRGTQTEVSKEGNSNG